MRFTLLSRRVAIVTGAASGLGRSIALRLARDGHDIAVADLPGLPVHDVVREVEYLGGRAMSGHVDVRSEEGVEQMVRPTAEDLGSVDIVSFGSCSIRECNALIRGRRLSRTLESLGSIRC